MLAQCEDAPLLQRRHHLPWAWPKVKWRTPDQIKRTDAAIKRRWNNDKQVCLKKHQQAVDQARLAGVESVSVHVVKAKHEREGSGGRESIAGCLLSLFELTARAICCYDFAALLLGAGVSLEEMDVHWNCFDQRPFWLISPTWRARQPWRHVCCAQNRLNRMERSSA